MTEDAARRLPLSKLDQDSYEDDANEVLTPGAVYLGRIPHGFYENEMKSYFSQFGAVTRLRLSRNKITGKSKHYAFIEFASSSVAKIVAETMNNYLLYGHILKCHYVAPAEYHSKMWLGANRRWKVVPIYKLRQKANDRKRPQEEWDRLDLKEKRRRLSKQEKWQRAGIDYSLSAKENEL